jgi:tetratricopeptide (TPR) repeat protein
MTARAPSQSGTPPSLAALEHYPWLRASIQQSITHQLARIHERTTRFVGRSATLAQLGDLIRTAHRGLVTLEGAAGSGVTTLLAYLAATHPVAFWFYDDDARQGAAALAAQLIALHRLSVPLVSPALNHPAALEQLIAEAAAQRRDTTPMIILVDPPAATLQPRDPYPMRLPSTLPPDVLLLYGCVPGTPLPQEPVARIVLPEQGDDLLHDQRLLLQLLHCPDEWIEPLCVRAQGNMLYLRFALGLCRAAAASASDVQALPPGLEQLHHTWWSRLDAAGQRLALLLAAASAPMPRQVCNDLLGSDAAPLLDSAWIVADERGAALYHPATCDYLARHQPQALRQAHADMVALALQQGVVHGEGEEGLAKPDNQAPAASYLVQHVARHAALGTPHTRETALALVTQRNWIRTRERDSMLADAAHDVAWQLYGALAGDANLSLLRLLQSTALAGTLFSRARTLAPDAAVAAFKAALEHQGREAALKRVLALVNQLPDGHAKAQVLRQLGETCFSLKARSSAMRLLSQALDIEEQRVPPSWREQREQLQMKLVDAALQLEAVDAALEIASRIGHVERRGMAEKTVVYWLREHGHLARAEAIASAIAHESLRAWTQAEVAVTMARAGEMAAAEHLLQQVMVETARLWAEIELACDEVAVNAEDAHARINQLPTPNQRNHGLARLAEALGSIGKHHEAIDTTTHISNMGVRLQALLNLVEMDMEHAAALRALEQATAGIGMLDHDVRVPLVAMLTASFAALGNNEKALTMASYATEGEERDRALSRVAIAMVQHGNYEQGLATIRTLEDDDERDWTLDEVVRILAEAGRWQEADELIRDIRTEEQCSRTLANLAIARARSDDPLAARELAVNIHTPAERARAFRRIVPFLVRAGHTATALELIHADLPLEQVSRHLLAVATALADQGELEQSIAVTRTIAHPLNQAMAYLVISRASAHHVHDPHNLGRARTALVTAMQAALLGRTEAFQILEHAIPTLLIPGNAALLTALSAAIEELDRW